MDRRQLVRIGAVVVAALVLCVLAWQGFRADDADPAAATEDPRSYAGIAAGVQRQLDVYGALAEATVSHGQAHAFTPKMEGVEQSLVVLRDRALELGTDDGRNLAVLADFVCQRGLAVRDEAARDHLGTTGLESLNAFGREVSYRAERMAAADTDEEMATEVSARWPVPEAEGQRG